LYKDKLTSLKTIKTFTLVKSHLVTGPSIKD
jgi:hypothetical protein